MALSSLPSTYMLNHLGKWSSNSVILFPHPTIFSCSQTVHTPVSSFHNFLEIRTKRAFGISRINARRRVIYDGEEYGYNEEVAVLEMYTQLVKDEILLVEVMVDEEQVQLLIFKGFSSCLSLKTCSDPWRSVVPAKAVIKSIDRAKGPFDPSDIQYIERGLTFDAFKTRLSHPN